MRGTPHGPLVLLAAHAAALFLAALATPAAALPPVHTPLTALSVGATTGEKPQSKVWTHAGRWWCVMPNGSGTWVWRLDGTSWTSVLQLSAATGTHADVKAVGGVAHVLLFDGASSQLASIEYASASQSYQFWTTRPGNVSLPLDGNTETATIDVDSQGRMWLATDHAAGADQIVVYYSDAPYGSWSGPVTLATGINGDDIAAVTAMPGGKIGVLWSNQNTQRFGFRTHADGGDPGTWTADEVPASQSALNVGAGMADDHLHVAVGSDGTLYAAVKTSYDTAGYPKIALLVRRPVGTWDDLYPVDEAGTRGIVVLDEAAGTVAVVYTTSEGSGDIVYKETRTSAISLNGARSVLMAGGLNDATSMKANVSGSAVVLAGNGSSAAGVLFTGGPAGWWRMEEGSGSTVLDASGNGNHGSLPNGATWVSGVASLALNLNGTNQYVSVPHSASLDLTGSITLAAWVRPTKLATQNIIAKTNYGAGNPGYELNLASATSTGKPFVRFNGTNRLDAATSYAANVWTHVAATYDGATIRIYVNGVLDNSAAAALTIQSNTLPLGIGGQSNGDASRIFSGAIDDARVYGRALSDAEIAVLANRTAPAHTITASAGAGGSISPSGAVSVADGTSQAFAITADGGYHVADVLVDGSSAGAVTGYTFTNVSADHTIAASFAADAGSGDLVGWWALEGGAVDSSTYSNHGSLPGGGSWLRGVEGQGLSLNGSSQYVSVPDDASLRPTAGLTLAAWIRPNRLATQAVIAKETYSGTPVWGYALELSSVAPGVPFFRLTDNTAGSGRLNGVTPYPQDGTTWMHLAATYDGATMRLYVNGVLDASQPKTGAIPTNGLPLAIGSQSTVESGRMFSGAVDEVRVYSRALSATEIQALLAHTIAASAGAHGAISPAGAVTVAHGGTQAFAITPDGGYHVADVLVDGSSVGAVAGYTFAAVTQSHTIAASFSSNAPPGQPALAGPADGATGVAAPPTLDVVPGDPDSPLLSVSFYGRAVNGPPGPDFTVVALPDAQNYTGQANGGTNAMFRAQTQWCVDQRVARAIAYVAQLGDCVNDASVTVEWLRADTTFRLLEDPAATGLTYGIPYGIAVGNHDEYPKDSPDNSTANYNLWFGPERFAGRPYYGGHFADNGDTWFQLFSASGVDFIVIGLEYDGTPDANRLSWADSILKAFPDRRAIVVGHYLIEGNGSWSSPGLTTYNALRTNPNLFLMLCGHTGDSARRQDVYDGHTVNTLLADFQGRTNGGNGWLRYLEFSPADNVIRVRTYSPWLGQYTVTADSSNQFTLPYDMSGTSAFQLLGTVSNLASGAHATLPWAGLAADTEYEWYVTVTDGSATTTSPTWSFTTAPAGPPPDAVADLGAAPLASGNGGGGRMRVALSWTPPAQPGTARVYRRAFGDYPRYRDRVGAEPAVPGTPAAAAAQGWTLTAVTAPGQSDEPGARGYWYYVLFTEGAGGASAPSNRAAALDYLLGDVHDGVTDCNGDNLVGTADVSYLGAHYGASPGSDESLACLDVGPTTDGALSSRPAPDDILEFEDLVLFALHFGASARTPAAARPLAAGVDAVALAVPALPPPGGTFAVRLTMSGTGRVAALSAQLAWDPAVVEPAGVERGPWLAGQGAPAVVLSSRPGDVDVALLGKGAGLAGSGELARVLFRVKAPGEAGIRLASVEARDGANRRVALADGGAAAGLPARTDLHPVTPNPFRGRAALGFSLARPGAIELVVYSVDGRRVRTLLRGERPAGEHWAVWDGADDSGTRVRAGIYFARLSAGPLHVSRRLVLLE